MATDVATTTTGGKAVRLVDEWRADLGRMEGQFKLALPAHIPVERFLRVCMTALQNNQKLLACSRQSFFNAAMKCAQDGLLPDGREAAIVPFGEEDDGQGGGRSRSDLAGYMPMVHGIRKKVRNSGEMKDLHAHVVYAGDDFAYQLGDDPFVKHIPKPGGRVGRKITHVYSIAVFNDGTLSRDVMPIEEVEDIRKKFSRSKKGPWSVPESYPEMCIKTVVKHHAKSLPMSTDLDRVMHRDDALYDFAGAADRREPVQAPPRPASIASAFDIFASDESAVDAEGGGAVKDLPDATTSDSAASNQQETEQERTADRQVTPDASAGAADAASSTAKSSSAAPTSFVDPIRAAEQRGREDHARGMTRKAVPPEFRTNDKTALANAWIKGWDQAATTTGGE
jgi:recombination protein RecT